MKRRGDLRSYDRPMHHIRDAGGHQRIRANFLGRFRSQHDRHTGRCRMQRRRKFERCGDRSEISHNERVESLRRGPASGQCRLGA